MQQDHSQLVSTYNKRARHYDLTANLYYLIGLREWAYRKQAIRALKLQRGDRVVEIGCGTGLNFPLLLEAVGSGGAVVGVDITPTMWRSRAGGSPARAGRMWISCSATPLPMTSPISREFNADDLRNPTPSLKPESPRASRDALVGDDCPGGQQEHGHSVRRYRGGEPRAMSRMSLLRHVSGRFMPCSSRAG